MAGKLLRPNKILRVFLSYNTFLPYFVYIFPNFRYYGNMGWSESNFTCTVKSAENTQRERILSPLQVVLWPILCLNLSLLLLCQQELVYSKRLSDNVQLANIETKTKIRCKKCGAIRVNLWQNLVLTFPSCSYHRNRGSLHLTKISLS